MKMLLREYVLGNLISDSLFIQPLKVRAAATSKINITLVTSVWYGYFIYFR